MDEQADQALAPSIEDRLASYFSRDAAQPDGTPPTKKTDEAQEAPDDQSNADEVNPLENEGQAAEQQPEEEGQETQADQPPLIAVTVKSETGEDINLELPLEEVTAGYMRQADYTRKTQSLKREAEATITAARQEFVEGLELSQAAIWQLAASDLQGVDWESLARTDPATYVEKQARAQKINSTLSAIQQALNEHKQKAQAERQATQRKLINDNAELLKKDGYTVDRYHSVIAGAKQYGFSPDELAQVIDARVIRMMDDAQKYRALQVKKPLIAKQVAKAPKAIKPGASGDKADSRSSAERDLRTKLKRSGRLDDAVALYAARNRSR